MNAPHSRGSSPPTARATSDAEAAALFRGLLAGSRDAIIIVDRDGTLLEANDVALDWVGYSRDEAIGRMTVYDFVAPHEQEHARASMEASFTGQRPQEQFTIRRRDGSELSVEKTAALTPTPHGERVVVIARDVTERLRQRERLLTILSAHTAVVQAETAEQGAEAALRVFERHMPLGAASIGLLKPGTRTMSLAACRGLDADLVQFFSSRLVDVDHDTTLPARAFRRPTHVLVSDVATSSLPVGIRRRLTEMGCVTSGAVALWSVEGEPFGVLMVSFPEKMPRHDDGTLADGEVASWIQVAAEEIGTCIDRLRSQERLHEALTRQRRLTDEFESFTYRTSHDLSEPIRGISTLASYAREDLALGHTASADELLQRITATADRLKAMIASLLEMSHTTGAAGTAHRWNLVDAARAVADELAPLLRERRAVVANESPMPDVVASRRRVHAALSHLVRNAIVHNPAAEMPRVWIRAWDRGDGLAEVSVRDNGPGIPPAERERVFDVFRSGTRPPDAEKGIGAGLAIARRAIAQEGGDLWLDESSKGGADFRFTLLTASG